MCPHLSFFILIAVLKAVHASDSGLLGDSSDQLFFDEQSLLPSDLTELALDQQSSATDDTIWNLSSDTSIPYSSENIASSSNDFSMASDPFAFADCSTSDNYIFPATGKSRLRRLARCDAPDTNQSPPMISIPSDGGFDDNLRNAILRENPSLYDTLRVSQNNEDDNTACVIITVGILPVGVCSSLTINDWTYKASRTFPWNWIKEVTLWDLSYVTPGRTKL